VSAGGATGGSASSGASGQRGTPLDLPEFGGASGAAIDPKRISMLHDVNLNVKIELGRTRMLIEDVLRLGEGSLVELDKLAGDPVDVFANDRLIARGEVLVLNDSFCVRISEVFSADPHRICE
jgi:flagellar motor switch protein FliN/FliY